MDGRYGGDIAWWVAVTVAAVMSATFLLWASGAITALTGQSQEAGFAQLTYTPLPPMPSPPPDTSRLHPELEQFQDDQRESDRALRTAIAVLLLQRDGDVDPELARQLTEALYGE